MKKQFKYGNVESISSRSFMFAGDRFRIVNRVHTNGYSETKLIWKFSEWKDQKCWCTVYHIDSKNPINITEWEEKISSLDTDQEIGNRE